MIGKKNILLQGNKGYKFDEESKEEVQFQYNYPAIKRIVEEMPYAGNGRKVDTNVEHMAALPPLAEIFYELVLDKKFPTLETFFEEVLSRYFIVSEDKSTASLKSTGVTYSYEGVTGRLYRMYPSLLRDYLFFILCTLSNQFDKVTYSLELDWVYGYDLLITHGGQKFGIALFTSTKRAYAYRGTKAGRRKKSMDDVIEISLTINPFDQSKSVGRYALYNSSDVDNLKFIIGEHLKDRKVS